jgi:hypothetical protein
MDENISYKMCAVKVPNAKLRNYLKLNLFQIHFQTIQMMKVIVVF